MSSHTPPATATKILTIITPKKYTENILGDLEEDFHRLCKNHSHTTARRWYWRQTAKAVTEYTFKRLRDAALVERIIAIVKDSLF